MFPQLVDILGREMRGRGMAEEDRQEVRDREDKGGCGVEQEWTVSCESSLA